MEPITVSYLPTKEDYIDFKVGAGRAAVRQQDLWFMRVCGGILILAGLVGKLFFGGQLYTDIIYVLLILYGVFLLFYLDILQPSLIKRSAGAYYDTHGEKMISVSLIFSENSVQVVTDRYTATLPYSMLWRIYEDKKGLIFYTGIGEMHYIPKRVLSLDECEQIRFLFRKVNQQNHHER